MRAAAEAFLRSEQAPLPVRSIAMWYSNADEAGMVCGEIEAPAALRERRSTLRYVYGMAGSHGQVEMHEMIVTGSPVSAMLIEQNRATFNGLWDKHCQPFAPVSRRLAAMVGL